MSLKSCKLPEGDLGRLNVGRMCFLFGVETSEPDHSAVTSDIGLPSAVHFVPRNALESRSTTLRFNTVGRVLALGCRPNVLPSIVQAVTVRMVVHRTFGQAHSRGNNVVHLGGRWGSPSRPQGVPEGLPCFRIVPCVPLPLHQEVVINGINSGELSLRERNQASICNHSSKVSARARLADSPSRFLFTRIPGP